MASLRPTYVLLHTSILLFLTIAGVWSCRDETINTELHITMNQAKKVEKPSDIVQSLRYLPLDTKPEYLISEVLKLHCQGDRIYILNNVHPERTLIAFDDKGNYLFKAGNTEGPGKVMRCNDFLVDGNSGNIELIDGYQKKIVRFDGAGNYLTSIPTHNPFDQIRKLPSGGYVCYSGDEYVEGGNEQLIHLTSDNFKIEDSYIPAADFSDYPSYSKAYFSNNLQYPIYFWQHFSSIVWKIEGRSVKSSVKIDFGENWIDKTSLSKIANMESMGEQVNFLNGLSHVKGISYFDIVDGCQFFTYYQKGKLHWNLYNPQSKDLKSISLTYDQPIANGIDGGMMPFAPLTVLGDELVFLMEPKQLLDFVNKQSAEQEQLQSPALRDLLKRIQPNDNAIVVFVKLRC